MACWNALGHCFWKKGDFTGAVNCFGEALSQNRTSESLRMLSMVKRQMRAKDIGESFQFIDESLQLAKEAVSLDFQSHEAWCLFR